jgi:hypothetical protein
MSQKFSIVDISFALLSDQYPLRGTSVEAKSDKMVFFIMSIDGATATNPVTLKDANGVVVTIINEERDFHYPLKFEKGFEMTAGTAATVWYAAVPNIK